jgi:general secretion pathway protein L
MTIATQVFTLVQASFRWWFSELAGVIPAKLKHLSADAERLVVLLEGGDALLFFESPRTAEALGRIPLDGNADRRQQLHAILRQRGLAHPLSRGRIGICLRIPARKSLRIRLDLPVAAEDNLGEVVGFELDRRTPFRPEQVHFAYRVLKREALAQRVTVEVTIVPRSVIDEVLKTAACLGLEPNRIDAAAATSAAAPSENLLADNGAQVNGQTANKVTYGIAALAIILAVIAAMIPIHAMQQRAEALGREFATMKKSAEALALLQKEADALRDEEGFLVERKGSMPTVSRVLFDTTRVLPDDTWLNELQLAGADVQLIGFTASASALIGLLEQSQTFRNTTFRSPVTRSAQSDRERFHVAARIVQAGRIGQEGKQ